MKNLLAIPIIAIDFLIKLVIAYIKGGCFLIFHPFDFVTFVETWQDYKAQIEYREAVESSGMNREQRRSLGFR